MSDSRSRSVVKALSYRLGGSACTVAIVWAISGRLDWAGGAGVADLIAKLSLFYLHERLWDRIPFGRSRDPEFEI